MAYWVGCDSALQLRSTIQADILTSIDSRAIMKSDHFLLTQITRIMSVLRILALALALLMTSGLTASYAQTTLLDLTSGDSSSEADSADASQSPEAIRALVSQLFDEEVRALLLDGLDAVALENSASPENSDTVIANAFAFLKFWGVSVFKSSTDAIIKVPVMLSTQAQSINTFFSQRGASGTLNLFGLFLAAIILGLIVEWVVRKFTGKWAQRTETPVDSSSFKESLQLLGWRLFLDFAGLIAFTIVAATVVAQIAAPADREFFSFVLFNVIVGPRFLMALVRFLLAPNRPELRLVHTDDTTAKFIYKHAWGLYVLIGVAGTIIRFNALNGFPPGMIRIAFWASLSVNAYVIYIVWHSKEGIRQMLIGKDNDVTPIEKKIANLYPYLMIALSVLLWLIVELIISIGSIHLLGGRPHIVTLTIFLFVPAMDTLIRAVVGHMTPPMEGEGIIATRAYYSSKRSYLRIGRVLIFGLLVLIVMDVWQIQLHNVASGAVGATVASNFIRLLIILSIGYLFWEIVSLLINRRLAAEDTAAGLDLNSEEPGGGEGGGVGSSRLSTILPLLRFILQFLVITMTILIGLSNIGINVTPLLAGAGVIGIAVGFGSQKLVGDVVSGLFFLIDDAFRAGEYISIEGTVGTVEKISLRSMQLRHHRGAVHTIPYGEIPKLTNFSRDWVMMKLKFTVPFNTDIKKVKNLFKKIGADVVDLPQFSDDLLQPFKFQGVLQVNDVGLVVGGKFMAKPGTQFMMRKELYVRIQKAFDENGIQFARKEVRVKLDEEEAVNLSPSQQRTIAGAAANETEEEVDVAPPKDDR